MDSLVDYGMPLDHDMFSTGANPHGCGHVPRTVHSGLRTTAADYITKDNHRDNVTILVNATVEKVILEEENGEIRATGVIYLANDGTELGIALATKEVIVSGGSLCSPAILNRSGIGSKVELEQHGIETRVDLPGVGKNLMDHLVRL
jgi:choline dehydrogenase-like flavoprotein